MSLQTPFQLTNLPPELRERIFLHLAPAQIVKLREVNRNFCDIVDGSPEAQYIIDLYAAGLEAAHQDPSPALADRRELLNRYRSHWESLQWTGHTSLPLPPHRECTIQGGVICLVLSTGAQGPTTDYHFIQLASVLRGTPLREWTLRGLPNSDHPPTLFPEEDLLVIFSPGPHGRLFTMQLLRMSDGHPHPKACIPILDGPTYRVALARKIAQVGVTASRLAVVVRLKPARRASGVAPYHFYVWDWKAGVEHMDLRCFSIRVQFIDEYRLFGCFCDPSYRSQLSAILLDTSATPQKGEVLEFELGDTGFLAALKEGTYAWGEKLGSPFRADRGRRAFCIAYSDSKRLRKSFVIDCESICAIASENKLSTRIPWEQWGHKTTHLDHYLGVEQSFAFVGSRVLFMRKRDSRGAFLSLDFASGAFSHIEKPDSPSEAVPAYAVRHVTLMDWLPEWRRVTWAASDDGVLSVTETHPGGPQVLRTWTF